MKFFCLLTIFLFLGARVSSQIKIKTRAPLANKILISANSESSSLIKELKKNGLVVIFSCNTCPFVVGSESFPGWENQYNNLYDQALKLDMGLVLINSNEGKRAGDDSFLEMKSHAEKKGYKMHYLMDEGSELANAFEAKTTPHVYLFNAELSLIYAGSIDNIWDKDRKETIPYLLNAMLQKSKGKKVKTKNTAPKGCSIKRAK